MEYTNYLDALKCTTGTKRYHIKLYAFPGEKGKFLLHDIFAILNLINVLENSHEVPAS